MAQSCVRVEPPLVEFNGVKVGEVYKVTVTATNVGNTLKKITLGKPASKLFKLTAASQAVVVAPGLSVRGLLEFTPETEVEVRDCLLVHVDDKDTLKIPLQGLPRACCLSVDPLIDFGCVVATRQVLIKHHPITNTGSAPGAFQVEYCENLRLSISPSSGVVAAGATQQLKVELHTDFALPIREKALLKLQNRPAVLLRIRGEVVDQCFEVFDLQGSPLSCLWFGPAYFGTSCMKNVVLKNKAPEACDWICLLQETAAGTEVGTNIQKSTDAALLDGMEKGSPATQDVSQILVCEPRQGRLGPYEKTTVAVRFSPICKSSAEKKKRDSSVSRQDYSLFLLFESVKSKHGFTTHWANSSLELAVTGSGLPVSLVPGPSHRFHFPSCAPGQHLDLLCVLQNLCPQLPVNFRFHKLAHFSTKPSAGVIAPGQCQDVVVSFNARQQGSFQVQQKVDVLGLVVSQRADHTTEHITELELRSFHTITLHFSAVCHSETTHPMTKVNPVTNPWPDVRFTDLASCRGMTRVAVLSADKTRLHEHHRERSRSTEVEEFLAFPDDRAASIRPASPHRQYRTIFTGVPRYSYVDTDYSFTKDEEEQRQRHRQIYADFIKQLRQTRLQRINERQQEKEKDDVDIGIVPSQGLVPPTLRLSDLERDKTSETNVKNSEKSSGSNSSRPQNSASNRQQVSSQASLVMYAVPSTSQEVADCNRTLTAEELCQVVISPLWVDFGFVCVQSVCVQTLELVNKLSVYVWVQLEVDSPELQGSSPLSHVLPPHSRITLPLTFQSKKLGSFYRPVSYSINQQHPGQILVNAEVLPLTLNLLHPTCTLLAASGYRSSVTLKNRRNRAAEFTWQPVVTENGILFSVRPATGVVEPYRELDCEVVWHPSFSSPSEGDFDLHVHEGNRQRLHCVAKVVTTSIQLAETQLTFGSVPLNMPSLRTAVLHNTGQNHGYYQVLDVCPLPGMVVSPSEGVVPSRGQAVLNIHFNPDCVIRFDTRVENFLTLQIALRSMKSIELRVGGSVEPPDVDISVSRFQFCGVHVGSQRVKPFVLTNNSPAAAWVAFDLSEYKDFSFQLPQPSANIIGVFQAFSLACGGCFDSFCEFLQAERAPGVSVVEIQGNQTLTCSLVFCPTQMASYDFYLPVKVNGVRWPIAPQSPFSTPSSSSSHSSSLSAGTRKHTVKPLPFSVSRLAQQPPCIQATVLCAPLEMFPSRLQFDVLPQSDTYTQKVELTAVCKESVFWRGITGERVCWWMDCNATEASTKEKGDGELCAASPSSGSLGPGQSICLVVSIRSEAIRPGSEKVMKLSLPLYLGDAGDERTAGEDGHQPYRELSITVTVQLPRITVHPPQILLTPVPLDSSTETTLTLLAVGYPSGTNVSAQVDEIKMEDGTKIQPVSVVFPEGHTIPAQDHDKEASVASLLCIVSFCSAVPLSLCTTITFTDHLHNRFKVKLFVTCDNCLLTVWPYLALHRSTQQIVLRTGATAVEAILQRCHTPSPTSCTTSSSSSFDHNSSTMRNSDSISGSDSVSGQASGDSEVSPTRETPTNFSVPEFPAASTETGPYYQSVLSAVERWFSLFGWPDGPHPITVPHTLRRVVPKTRTNKSSGRTYSVRQNKDTRSVVDMLQHLTGKQVRGFPHCQTFSSDTDQRTNQLLQQHEVMLAFLRVQGAFLCHIRPEFLLDELEFKHWCSLQSNDVENDLDYNSVDYESLSKRSWTDVLLQIYKVLVLCRVSEIKTPNSNDVEDVEGILTVRSQPLASNVYSSWELQLLSWLNMHYQNMREAVWSTSGVPSARWIVNFDLDLTDGLVLGALLAAYCPYLIRSHFQRMYTTSSNLEQILHNNIIVTQALTALGLNINIQPTDLSDPNPVQMLILCVHLYERLPQYLPLRTVTLSGALHTTFSKQVRLKSPYSQNIKYQAFIFGKDAHLFSLPNGPTVSVPPKSSVELTVLFSCSFLQPKEAVLLLISSSASGPRCTTLAFNLKTNVSHITPTNTVKHKSPCYQLNVVQVPLINTFNRPAIFRVMLVESTFNPLDPTTKRGSLVQHASLQTNADRRLNVSDKISGEEMEDGEGSEFLSPVTSVKLMSGQADTLYISYLPFCPGTKYCSVLLAHPKVGDMVFMIKATSQLPLPSSLSARPSTNIDSQPKSSDAPVSVPVLSLHCKLGRLSEEVLRVPRINMQWEQALVIWGRLCMGDAERRRRMLTHTLPSSTVRTTAAKQRLFKQPLLKDVYHSKAIEYSVEVSLPQCFTLPSTVTIPIKEDAEIPLENPADCDYVDIPLRFQADSVGRYPCQVVLKSWCDTRVYLLEALVTAQGESVHLDFSSPTHRSVTQHLPLHNETHQDWKMEAKVCGEGFSGPSVVNVPAGTRASYPLTFHPAAQGVVTGSLSLQNDCDGTEHVFSLRGVGERPLPVDHVVLRCTAGRTTHTQLDVPNYSQNRVRLKVVTDLSAVSGSPTLEIKPGHTAAYALAVSPWKRGKQTGCVSFVETDDMQEAGNASGCYEVHFSFEIICEPAAPVKVIDVQCATQNSVAIEIPVSNSGGEQLMLDVNLEGDDLNGANRVAVPPRETFTYKATFSPDKVGKNSGSVVFQSELVGEFWYQLELYALPPPVVTLPQACCQLGKWTRLTIPLVNPTAEALEMNVTNSNPTNYTAEMEGSTLMLEPRSSTQLGVRFRPSAIGERNHEAKIAFTCPELQECCVLLSGRGLNPETEKPLSISSVIGSKASINIPFTNPTDLPAELSITLTDEDPSGATNLHPVSCKKVFSIPLSCTEGVQISEGATFNVPVEFAPDSLEPHRAWLCINMTPISCLSDNSSFSPDGMRSEQALSAICWIYPLCGRSTEVPAENSSLAVVECEAGCQLQKKLDVLLTGCLPGNQDHRGQEVTWTMKEDFLCEVRSRGEEEHPEVEDCLSISVEAARRDPETGIVTLSLDLVYAPLRTCRSSGVLAVQSVSGQLWEFPFTLTATDPQVDDVILTETTELGKTSAVGFRLTSTFRRPKSFTAEFLPGSSSEFTVTPVSGILPPVDSTGLLFTVSFTPTSTCKRHTARLLIQTADVRWTYEVRGKTSDESPPLSNTSTNGSSSVLAPSKERNFVVRNLRLPSLANSSPLKVRR